MNFISENGNVKVYGSDDYKCSYSERYGRVYIYDADDYEITSIATDMIVEIDFTHKGSVSIYTREFYLRHIKLYLPPSMTIYLYGYARVVIANGEANIYAYDDTEIVDIESGSMHLYDRSWYSCRISEKVKVYNYSEDA